MTAPLALARMIDHTILKAEASEGEVRKIVAEALQYRFASVCVNPRWLPLVRELLAEGQAGVALGDAVLACAVVGFPLGANKSLIKGVEAASVVKDGAQEVDMVISLPALIAGNLEEARADVAEVVRNARAVWPEVVVKVILETAALTEEQIALGCRASREGGADFVKTSTGFHPKGGATAETVAMLKKYGTGMRVKASGGIRDYASAMKMVEAGADRLGCSSGVAIMQGAASTAAY